MCADLPPPFRLVVTGEDGRESQGTAWFVTRSKVITAWHVIDVPPGATFELEIGGKPIYLEYVPGSEDKKTDVAVLHVRKEDRPRIKDTMVLTLAHREPEINDAWYARGFPSRAEGMDRTVCGKVTNPSTGNQRLELLLEQGTFATWKGISGAALMIQNGVAGIVTGESQNDNTAFASPCSAVEKILPELRGSAHRLRYGDWFRNEFRPPEWCGVYTPKVTVNGPPLDSVDQLADQMIARRDDGRVWLIVGEEAEGREALLRRVADAFVRNGSIENEDCCDLPVWCTSPPYPNESADPLHLTQEKLKEDDRGISASDMKPMIAELRNVIKSGRALFLVDGADASGIRSLQRNIIGKCLLLAGVSEGVAKKVPDAQSCRIVALSDADRRSLAAHWLTDGQLRQWVNPKRQFLPLASSPLDVSIWCRAEVIFEHLMKGNAGKPEEQTKGNVDLLEELVDGLLRGTHRDDHPCCGGMQSEKKEAELRDVLAALAYLTLIDGVEEIEPTYIADKTCHNSLNLPSQATVRRYFDQASEQCGLLRKVKGNAYRFVHAALQEYMAASAMYGSKLDLNLQRMAEDAKRIHKNKGRITRWSRALALRLDRQANKDDAKEILGVLLNFGLLEGYGTQLRNKSGPLKQGVLQAVLRTDKLAGKELREALGWIESPNDWTGYRPDEWRTIEELLRYLDGLASRISNEESLALLLERMLRRAKVIDIALIRYSLAKVIKKRRESKRRTKKLEELYERERFFDIAGHSIRDCAKTNIENNLRVVPEGWFLMGAPESEERSWPNERRRHRVLLDTYRMARTEVTNEQYEVFDPTHKDFPCSALPPQQHGENLKTRAQHPVVRVSWYEAWCFAEWMGLKLPTEAQWEKAARGVTWERRPGKIPQDPMPYWFSKEKADLMSMAWFKENSHGSGTKEVDKLKSNCTELNHRFELGGLCGNVWEWCMDEQGWQYTTKDRKYPKAFEKNPRGNVITNRVIRGGSYDSPAWNCRHAVRHYAFPTVRADTIGFRLCTDSLEGA